MKPSLLLIVAEDPRTSPRPAEAIRIAAGVATWRKVEVSLYLRDAAVLSLGEFTDDLIDDDHFTRYLPIFGELGRPVLVQSGAPFLKDLGETRVPWREIADEELAQLAALHRAVARF